jgi:uncharacterized protein YdhG (YjbR/CyaY superfamily)
MADTETPAKRTASAAAGSKGFTSVEKAAMQQRAKELKAESRRGKKLTPEELDAEVRAKIAELSGEDREMAERIHAVVLGVSTEITPRLWYGMPAYAKGGKTICFFQPAAKFRSRYATFGFQEDAKLDEGTMWATSWAISKLTPADEARIASLVRRAVS